MTTLTPYKVGAPIKIGFGEHKGEEGVIISRQPKPYPEPAFSYGKPGAKGTRAFPAPSHRSWVYRVRLDSTRQEIELDHANLRDVKGPEWDTPEKA